MKKKQNRRRSQPRASRSRTSGRERSTNGKPKLKFPYFVLHPLFFGVFPILFLYAGNTREMRFEEILLPLALMTAAAIVVTLLLGLLWRNFMKSGIVASTGLVVIFSFGRLKDLTREWQLPYREYVILGALILLAVVAIVFLIRTKKNLLPLTKILNFAGGVLVVIQVAIAGAGLLQLAGKASPVALNAGPAPKGAPAVPANADPGDYPDIYYIIPDSYGRADTMNRFYQYDNSDFVGFLENEGFTVFREARSNYCQTLLSLSAVLNMNYIDDFITLDKDTDDRMPLVEKLRHNALFDFLKEHGYAVVNFSSGYEYTEIRDADVYLKPKGSLSEFQNILLTTTTLSIVDGQTAFDAHRRRIAYTLNTMPMAHIPGHPRFIFVHMVCPHPPFVFGPDGEKVEQKFGFSYIDGDGYMGLGGTVEEYAKGYFDEMTYFNKLMRVAVSQILEKNAGRPPVIVIQADHGPGMHMDFLSAERTNLKDRFSILYAIYLPGHTGVWRPIDSTPVNTFRVVLNQYFKADLPLLEPRSYYSTWPRPFIFKDITDRLEDKPAPYQIH
ncbi:MAG: hypothetical protein JXD23_04130 [Spirochaetales bacterium]|nr:hypothetical protein [Spirochaetales bacterium]